MRHSDSPPTVLVTGASAGIGRAIAREFARNGARIGLVARGEAGLDAAAAEVTAAGGTALAIQADVASSEDVDAAAGRVEAELGEIDVWVNAAFASIFAPFYEIAPNETRCPPIVPMRHSLSERQ